MRGRRIGDLGTLHDEVSAWSTDVNRTQRGVDWQMKVDDGALQTQVRISEYYKVTDH